MQAKNKKIDLTLRPSRFFFTLLSGMHLLFLLLACLAGFPWWVLLLLFVFIAFSYYWLIKKHIYRKSKYAVAQLWQDENSDNPNNWYIVFATSRIKQPIEAILKPRGYVSDVVITLHFVINRSTNLNSANLFSNFIKFFFQYIKTTTISVLIFPDMIDRKDYHALKLFLMGY